MLLATVPIHTYVYSLLQNPRTLLKFGYLWLFKQPSQDDFSKVILKLLSESEIMLQDFLKKEGVKPQAIGYRPDVKQIMLQMDDDFSIYQQNIDFEKNPQLFVDRDKDPDLYKKEVLDKLPHMAPVADEFKYALVRKCPTLNTAWFCERLYQILLKKPNVEFHLNSLISGYYISNEKHRKGHIEAIVIGYVKRMDVDDVILCLGPQARSHIYKHFDTVFPQISAQGYSVDLPDMESKHDHSRHVKIGDRGYAYAALQPGKHRVVALMDFGCHDEAFIDPARAQHLLRMLNNDLSIPPLYRAPKN